MKPPLPRRPFVFISASSVMGIAFCYIFSPPLKTLIAITVFFALLLLLTSKKNLLKFPLILAIFFMLFSIYTHASFSKADPLERYITDAKRNTPMLYGRVINISDKPSGMREFTVTTNGNKALIRAYYKDSIPPKKSDIIGKFISFRGVVSYPDTAKNPGGFDFRLHLLSKNIRIIINCKPNAITLDENRLEQKALIGKFADEIFDIYNKSFLAKSIFSETISEFLSKENAALLEGMMFGDIENIEEDTYRDFQRTGIAHILSVSGLHVGMLYAFVLVLFRKRKTNVVYFSMLTILLAYAVLSEFSPPVIRAVLMIFVHIFSQIFHTRFDLLTAIAISIFVMLLFNPLQLFGTGFILSYLAVTSLAFALPFVGRFFGYINNISSKRTNEKELNDIYRLNPYKHLFSRIVSFLIPAFTIQLMLVPITAYFFNYFSPISALLNIPVIALSSIVIPFGLFIFVFSCLSSIDAISVFCDFVVGVFSKAAGLMTNTILELTNAASEISSGSIDVVSPPIQLIFAFYCIAFFLMSESFVIICSLKKYGEASIKIAIIFIACVITIASPVCQINRGDYTFIDVGQGDALHIRTKDGKNYLVDGGGRANFNVGEKILKPYLLHNGVSKLDGIFVSHLHSDHFKGIVELSKIYDIGKVFVYEGNIVKELNVKTGNTDETIALEYQKVDYLKSGDYIKLGNNAFAEVLFPPSKTKTEYISMMQSGEDENESSLIMRFTNHDVSVLMTGDLSAEGESNLLKNANVKSDILKIGHHGSKYSSSETFLDSVSPIVAAIQVGKNNYGHPSQSVLDKLSKRDIITYRNDLVGAIIIDTQKSAIAVKTNKYYFVSKMLLKQSEQEYIDGLRQ